MKKILFGLLFLPLSTQAYFSYKTYEDWTQGDQLYYSTFNDGEKWTWHSALNKPEPESNLTLVEQINLCYDYGGGWNHYINNCVIEDESVLLDYVKALEYAEQNTFYYSSPPKNTEKAPEVFEGQEDRFNWKNLKHWSPEYQLHFSTFNTGEVWNKSNE